MFEKVGQILIPVSDIDRSMAFYRDKLGLDFLFSYPHMGFFQVGETRLFLNDSESPEFQGRATIYLQVPDINAAYDELQNRGVEFRDAPHIVHATEEIELWMAFMDDPDGHHIALMNERSR